ncbi:MAG TPA: hypothetical protein ENN60_00705 [archaeon]|nr:hypothetical protein [archaeon]
MTVSYSDFAKLDLRVGTIKQVRPVQGADKLYELTVNLGTETRTLVAGIRKWYEITDLVEQQVVVIANLEPKVIKGIRSHGMLLAAQDETTVAFLKPVRKVREGSKVL